MSTAKFEQFLLVLDMNHDHDQYFPLPPTTYAPVKTAVAVLHQDDDCFAMAGAKRVDPSIARS